MRRRTPAAILLAAVLLAGCGTDTDDPDTQPKDTSSSSPTAATEATTPVSTSPPATTSEPEGEEGDEAEAETDPNASPLEGIDASHHQGPIDWETVAEHGISFAYLKASEGLRFTDPRFIGYRTEAAKHGISVAGYHYFQLCTDGASQAAHFIAVVGKDGGKLAPALDLELEGSCPEPPKRDVLLAEVREFLAAVDAQYDTSTVVYLFPDFEDRYQFAKDLADHPQWVRSLDRQPPTRTWHIWQYTDRGTVPGISGGVDRNLMQPPS